jgi:oligopeptidase B
MRNDRPVLAGGVALMMGFAVTAAGCGEGATDRAEAPVARVEPTELVTHGQTRVDEYYWLRERESPEVVEYLTAENEYLASELAHVSDLRESLFDEIVGRIKEDDQSVPYRFRDYYYETQYKEGTEYPIHVRREGASDAPEQVMVDVNQLAEGHEYFAASVGVSGVSENQKVLAFGTDNVGRRKYTIRFLDLETGEFLADEIPDVTPNVAWAADDRTLFYTRQDPETLRRYQVFRHELGTDPASDVLVYEEPDEEFSVSVRRTKSRDYVFIAAYQTLSTEFRYVPSTDPHGEFEVILPREPEHEYSVDHFGDHFYFRTNDEAPNFRLVRAPVTEPSRASWEEVIAHRDDVLLEGFDIFRDHLVVEERENGLVRLRVKPWAGEGEHYVEFDDPAWMAFTTANLEYDTPVLRYGYTSMTTPFSTYDYDMETHERSLLKQVEVVGDFDPANYQSERLWAPARDGRQVPISLVYRKGFEPDGSAPLLLYGYGSYGASMDAGFSSSRLSLLDRGFVYAIAHIRGGEELGRWWYEEGKLLNKMNTFTDFIDAADFLVTEGYSAPDRVFAMGGSAGGLLMGAVVNLRPELWRGVVAAVPFVDVVTTMLDETIPLTTSEYDEWGNPNDPEYFDYMLSYSPYDNVVAGEYPNMLVTTGLHDSQVQYWEPAKWVARLRALKTDGNRLYLHTNMDAGHGGASGRFRRHRETALEYAFILDLAGITE